MRVQGCILTACGLSIVIFLASSSYILFDTCHSEQHQGNLNRYDKTAALFTFSAIENVARHIRKMFKGNHHCQFKVVSARATVTDAIELPAETGSQGVARAETGFTALQTDSTATNAKNQPVPLVLTLADGSTVEITIDTSAAVSTKDGQWQEKGECDMEDKVNDLSSLILEIGFSFKNFLESIKTPNRPRLIRTLKLMMILLKADSNMCKYADEILRSWVLQLCKLSEEDSCQMFYACLSTQKEKKILLFPATWSWNGHAYKKHIKHMYSN